MSDEKGIVQGSECKNGIVVQRSDLSFAIEEADGRIIPHTSLYLLKMDMNVLLSIPTMLML